MSVFESLFALSSLFVSDLPILSVASVPLQLDRHISGQIIFWIRTAGLANWPFVLLHIDRQFDRFRKRDLE